ncbi:helix-turn-helix transcriptional regulator [Actinomadura darangshiensis]|uniref:helix-turn-helix transcriptional regulator n=1 Tax=Actinomadura darangshiensis TaxID=705336 RepID=UPI001FB7771D|nr:helix-turn-helix transcriptional regulator [Actinomadura darangshiensis]
MEHGDRAELAAFLRRWRARVQPYEVGLERGRRRTPGLRRQEVANLAGMSVDYYVRLEQGRGPRPSRQMLTALGRALRLTDDERSHLHYLAGEVPAPPPSPVRDVRPGLRHLLERLDDTPALVCDAKYDVLAWNPMATALLGDFSTMPDDERNIVLRFFTRPQSRDRIDPGDARRFAREAVADLRTVAARYPRDPGVLSLIERLLAGSDEFRALWAEGDVRVQRSARKRIRHPAVGWLDLHCEALHDPVCDQWTVFYTAAPGSREAEALRSLRSLAPTS